MDRRRASEIKGGVDFAIIAIREDEYEAILRRFPARELCTGRNRTYTTLARVNLPDGAFNTVACAPSIEQGRSRSGRRSGHDRGSRSKRAPPGRNRRCRARLPR